MIEVDQTANRTRTQDVFTKLGELGSGSYAKVYKVLKNQNNTEYALKVVNGDLLKRVNKVHEVHIEKRVLQKCNHKNIIKFHQSFKSGSDYYFLLEYCANGSLSDFIYKTHSSPSPVLPYTQIQFYICSLILALEHLHSHSILHRDLKPSNVLLTSSSLKLSDFNSCSLPSSPSSAFVGTPEYISPEVLLSQPQTALLDIWALGVLSYELYSGETPFAAPTEHLVYSQIMHGSYCTNINAPTQAIDFIQKCLKKDPTERLGYNPKTGKIDYNLIKNHQFFEGIDFANLSFPQSCDSLIFSEKQNLSKTFCTSGNLLETNIKSRYP